MNAVERQARISDRLSDAAALTPAALDEIAGELANVRAAIRFKYHGRTAHATLCLIASSIESVRSLARFIAPYSDSPAGDIRAAIETNEYFRDNVRNALARITRLVDAVERRLAT